MILGAEGLYTVLFAALGGGALTAVISGGFVTYQARQGRKADRPFREGDVKLNALTETVEGLLPSIQLLRSELNSTQTRLDDCYTRDEIRIKDIEELRSEVTRLRKRIDGTD